MDAMFKYLLSATFSVLSLASFAQPLLGKDGPSQADIAAKQKEAMNFLSAMPLTAKEIKQQLNANSTFTGAALTLNGTTPKAVATKEDFVNLARPDGASRAAQAPIKATPADLMIFVSLSMPDLMLEQYAAQAKRFNAVLMLRGFVNDKMSDTRTTLSRINKSGAQWEISPEPFKQFKIDKVPAIVLATTESGSITEDGCAKPETYTAIFGDISVSDALDKMSLRGQKTIALMAKARIMADRHAGGK